jgi:hypothetical protein
LKLVGDHDHGAGSSHLDSFGAEELVGKDMAHDLLSTSNVLVRDKHFDGIARNGKKMLTLGMNAAIRSRYIPRFVFSSLAEWLAGQDADVKREIHDIEPAPTPSKLRIHAEGLHYSLPLRLHHSSSSA